MIEIYLESPQVSREKSLENLAKIPPNPSVFELGSERPDEVPVPIKALLIGQIQVSALDSKAYLVICAPDVGCLVGGWHLV